MTDFTEVPLPAAAPATGAFASKKSSAARKPRVTVSNPGATAKLLLEVSLPEGHAKAISAWANGSDRRKADAAAVVRAAVEELAAMAGLSDAKGQRARDGMVQGYVPEILRGRLKSLAAARGTSAADLLRDEVHRWIDPASGSRRLRPARKGGDPQAGAREYLGPGNFRSFAAAAKGPRAEARSSGSLVRLQVELGSSVARALKKLIKKAKVDHGDFLTALAMRVCGKLEPRAELGEGYDHPVVGAGA